MNTSDCVIRDIAYFCEIIFMNFQEQFFDFDYGEQRPSKKLWCKVMYGLLRKGEQVATTSFCCMRWSFFTYFTKKIIKRKVCHEGVSYTVKNWPHKVNCTWPTLSYWISKCSSPTWIWSLTRMQCTKTESGFLVYRMLF